MKLLHGSRQIIYFERMVGTNSNTVAHLLIRGNSMALIVRQQAGSKTLKQSNDI